jgi:hypothetical protein
MFSYGRWNVTAGTLIQQNAATTPSTPALSVGTKTGANEIGRFETNGADASLSFRNTSSIPSDWQLMFPGTGTGTPAAGNLVFRDAANSRNLLHLSKATGAVGVGPSVNGYTSPGDLSVGRNANSGGVFFSTGTQALLDYGVTAPGKFNFSGGPVQAVATSTSVNVVTFSATPTFEASLGNTQKITLTGNVTSSTLSNAATGQQINFLICQDGTGGWTFVWPTNVKGGMTIGSDASKCNAQNFIFDGTNAYALSPGATNM